MRRCWILLVLACGVSAQVRERKWEVGGHYALLRLSCLKETAQGTGGRVTYNVNDFLAVEGEANYFPRGNGLDRKIQILAGIRAGIRNRRYGLFFKARPGVIDFPSLSGKRLRFVLDVGGVIELYPTRRAIFRVDLSDTRILIRTATFPTAPPLVIQDSYGHNFQMSAGVGLRF